MASRTLRTCFAARSAQLARPSLRRPRRAAARAFEAPQSSSGGDLATDELWDTLSLHKRELQLAVAEEDYGRATQLKASIAALTERLPLSKQLMLATVDKLTTSGSLEQQRAAATALGELGDADAIPYLAAVLADPKLADWAESAMWALFMRCPSPETQALMESGCRAMQHPAQWGPAIQMFSDMIRIAPSFAEGYNKRATVLFLMHRYQDAIDDCRVVLDLNPYHFGALAGMGMCLAQSGRFEEAIRAFEQALTVHPQLVHLRSHIEALREQQRQQE